MRYDRLLRDDRHHRHAVVGGRPEGLDGVERTAVTYQGDDRPVRQTELDAHGGRQGPPDPATADAVEAVGIVAGDEQTHALIG